MTERPIINRVCIITQSGEIYGTYASYDYAADERDRLAKQYPWFTWKLVTTTINFTTVRTKETIK